MRVNEIFYSLQGEGAHAGEAAIFVRLSGCNLSCSFCDTKHQEHKDLTEDEITLEIAKYPASWVVITGGEPTLQLTKSLVDKIHDLHKFVAIETNGIRPIPEGVDWVTCSPKSTYVGDIGKPILKYADEVKVVFDDEHEIDDLTFGINAIHYYAQPCDTGDIERNQRIVAKCVEFVKQHPARWSLSLQQQKILNIR
ncbi:MAG: radical SAM protein [Paludibacteraceae bacterium]|nr:radical SAM protein [Paludibacteraceae bacterium]MBQ6963508.1 radical SAM protein [Paludibacteraceae bacterium]MBQ7662479.1 radical SAM protein [Prevotella sp.]MBQ7748298.1 radical SAM protein [Paludibacteraceae bacterium]